VHLVYYELVNWSLQKVEACFTLYQILFWGTDGKRWICSLRAIIHKLWFLNPKGLWNVHEIHWKNNANIQFIFQYYCGVNSQAVIWEMSYYCVLQTQYWVTERRERDTKRGNCLKSISFYMSSCVSFFKKEIFLVIEFGNCCIWSFQNLSVMEIKIIQLIKRLLSLLLYTTQHFTVSFV
jgi:hypothetical protein